jgi:diguanylate cyclase (GGDEF)-like protein
MPYDITRLPDRFTFTRELQTRIDESQREGFTLALLIIKVLHLHEINTTYGYQSGDALLAETASRIGSMLRSSDILYRIGDNTFALVLPTLESGDFARLAVNKLLSLIEEPFDINAREIRANVKLGIALSPEHTTDAERLSHYADSALQDAINGAASYQFHNPDRIVRETHSVAIQQGIHSALENDELMLYFQPQLDLQSNTLCGMEALIRWNSPTYGFVPPDEFIPLAENSGLILPLTLWTFNTAMRQCKWLGTNQVDVAVSINLSASVLYLPDLVEHVTTAMKIWDIPADRLVLEITESAFMKEPEKSLDSLKRLHETGISLSIDDFGTGYSSMAYLSRLPIRELKIDKSFVMNMMKSDEDHKIVRSIIELAHNLDLTVVAEGVEDNETLEKLISLGCDRGQGYYFGRPMPIEEFREWSIARDGMRRPGT